MGKKRILIIDDEPMNRDFLEKYLSRKGYDIVQAGSCDEGMETIMNTLPDLILLDVKMPGKNGFDTLKEIKRNPAFATIPIIFISGYDQLNLKVKGLELGAEDYISRPFENEELLARIHAVMRRCGKCDKDRGKLEGNLKDLGLIELLQTIELGKKTAVVNIKEFDAQLVMEDGALVYARLGKFEGRDAVCRIFLVDTGDFSVKFNKIPPHIEKNPVRIMRVVMNTSAYLDEVKTVMRDFNGHDNIRITPEIKAMKGAEKLEPNTVIPLQNLICTLEGDLKEIVKKLVDEGKRRQ